MDNEVYKGDFGQVVSVKIELSNGSEFLLNEEEMIAVIIRMLKSNREKLSVERMLYRIHDLVFSVLAQKLGREITAEEKIANADKVFDLARKVLRFYNNPQIN